METLNVANFAYNYKKVGTTFESWRIMCIINKWKKNANKVGYCNKMKNVMMC
jgi:hypothetical protein